MRLINADELKKKKKHSHEFAENIVSVAEIDWQPTVEAIPVEHVEKMIESVKSLPNVDYSLKYFAVNVMDALILGWRAEQEKQK